MEREYLADLDGHLAYCVEVSDEDGCYRKFWKIGGKSAEFTEQFGHALPHRVRAYRCGTGSLWGIDVRNRLGGNAQFLLAGDTPFDHMDEGCTPWDASS